MGTTFPCRSSPDRLYSRKEKHSGGCSESPQGGYIMGGKNIVVDVLNHHKETVVTEWSLSPRLFEEVCRPYRRPVDISVF